MFQESPGRTASGSPRPAGRAGQPSVTSGSPMAAVKKPDPNMKGKGIYFLYLIIKLFFIYFLDLLQGFSVLSCNAFN